MNITFVSAETVIAFDDAYTKFAVGMGFMEDKEDAPVTRGEFTQILCNMLNISFSAVSPEDAWYDKAFNEDNANTLVDNSGFEQRFLDVPVTHENYLAILKITDLGYMLGTSETEFSPDEFITEEQVVKVFVTITGNEYLAKSKGGYPYGYNIVAATSKMFDNYKYNSANPMYRSKLAHLIYNTVKMDLTVNNLEYDKVVFSTEDGINILNRYHSVVEKKGRVEANEFTALDDGANAGENKTVISGNMYGIEKASYVRDMLGYDVVYYYNTDTNEIIYAAVDKNCEITRFDSREIEKFSDYKLYYYTDEERSDTDYIDLSRKLNVIYNGTYQNSYTKDLFEFDFGDITVINSQYASENDTVIINDYETYYLTDVADNLEGIYAASVTDTNASLLDLSGVKVNCYDENGALVDISTLKSGVLVDLAKGDDHAVLKTNTQKLENVTIGAIETDDEVSFITSDGNVYTAYKKWYDALKEKPIVGSAYTIYLNSYGFVCKIEKPATAIEGTYNLYLGSQCGRPGRISSNTIEIIAIDSKQNEVTYTVDKNVKVMIGDTVIKGSTMQEIYTKLTPYLAVNTVFMTTLSADGKLNKVIFPSADDIRENEFGKMSEGEEVYYCAAPTKMFGNSTIMDKVKIIFVVDLTASQPKDKYVVADTTILSEGNYKMAAYNANSNSVIADCAVVYTSVAKKSLPQYYQYAYIAEKIKTISNDDGEVVETFEGYGVRNESNALSQVYLTAKPGITFKSIPDYTGTLHQVEKGDVLMMKTFNGEIVDAYIVYKANKVNQHGSKGDLLGTTNIYTPLEGKPNPYTITNALEISTTSDVSKYHSGSARVFSGYVTKTEADKYITYTNYLGNAKKHLNDSRYITETTLIPTNFVVVNQKPFVVKKGTSSDIKTYEKYGEDCSRIYIHTWTGRIRTFIIFN